MAKKGAAKGPTFEELMRSIATKSGIAPVYVIHGEEGYYTDRLVEAFEGLIPEGDRDFNLLTLYGPQTNAATIHEACRRYPMMADRQVVIVREAQAVNANELNKLAPYVKEPSPTTVLVLAFRGEKAKGTELLKAAASTAVIFESQKLKSGSITTAIGAMAKAAGLNIEPKGMQMLADFTGADLSLINREIDKLRVGLGEGAMITPEAVERHVGISKEFNSFEFVDALADRQYAKAFKIVDHFKANPKNAPWPQTLGTLFTFFSNALIYHYTTDKSPGSLMSAMGLRWESQLNNVMRGARNYNASQVIDALRAIRSCDVQSKGIGSRKDPYDLLHDMTFRILTTPGINADETNSRQ